MKQGTCQAPLTCISTFHIRSLSRHFDTNCISVNPVIQLWLLVNTWSWLRGHVHMTSAKFSEFLTPSPPCLHFGPIHISKFTQPPLLHLLLGYPPPPSHCRHHMYIPPYVTESDVDCPRAFRVYSLGGGCRLGYSRILRHCLEHFREPALYFIVICQVWHVALVCEWGCVWNDCDLP